MRDPRMCVLQVKRRDHENGRAFAYLPVFTSNARNRAASFFALTNASGAGKVAGNDDI